MTKLQFSRVLLVGDSHANVAWWRDVVAPAAERLGVDAIVQLGDFGWWPNEGVFRRLVRESAKPTWFLDGNHEHHPDLAEALGHARRRHNIEDLLVPVPLKGNLGHLPRGSRFSVGDVTVACVGGAHSIDRALRKIGVSYFDGEVLSDDDVVRAGAGGHADVLLCHDAPAGWEIPGLLPRPDLPPAWRGELPRCEAHRDLLRRVYEALTPRLVVHGHYHSAYRHPVDEAWGTVEVHGLARDTMSGSLTVLSAPDGVPFVEPLTR